MWHGALGAKACHPRPTLLPPLQPWFVKETAFFSAKAQNSRIRRSRILGIVCRFSPWNVFPPMKPAVWGFGWLWLGAFGRSRLYRCQSTPGPPMPCFVAQSFALAAFATLVCQRNCVFLCKGTKQRNPACTGFRDRLPFLCTELRFRRLCNFDLPNKQRFSLQRHKSTRIRLVPNSWDSYAGFLWHRASLLRLETHILPIAVCKSSRIRHSPNSGTVRRFPVLPTPCAKTAKSCAFCDSLLVSALECFSANETGVLISEFSAS